MMPSLILYCLRKQFKGYMEVGRVHDKRQRLTLYYVPWNPMRFSAVITTAA